MKQSYEIAIALYEAGLRAGLPADRCQCCGAPVAEGVKGCFELFAELPSRGYGDPRYRGSFYGVDAHALQHPEIHGKKNNAAHLLRLCWVFEHDAHERSDSVPRWWQRYLERGDVPPLEPPRKRGALTVVDVAATATPEQYAAAMRRWAESVYVAWAAHHPWARATLGELLR